MNKRPAWQENLPSRVDPVLAIYSVFERDILNNPQYYSDLIPKLEKELEERRITSARLSDQLLKETYLRCEAQAESAKVQHDLNKKQSVITILEHTIFTMDQKINVLEKEKKEAFLAARELDTSGKTLPGKVKYLTFEDYQQSKEKK